MFGDNCLRLSGGFLFPQIDPPDNQGCWVMFHLNKIQRLIVSIFIPIISMAVLGVSKYAPDTILVTILVAFLSELYLWRTIQPQRRRTLPSLPSKKQVSLTLGHLFASVIISIALSSNHEFKEYFGADDEGATAILLFFLYWGIIVVIPWGFRRVRTELKMNTLQKQKVKETSSVIPQESRQSADTRPNVLSLIDESDHKRFGGEIEKIENIKVTRRVDEN